MAEVLSLHDLPGDFGEHFLPYSPSLRQRQQARKYANESYVYSVKIFRGKEEITVKGRVFRSQRKNDDGHRCWLSMVAKQITEAFCTCKAGVSGECAHVLAVIMKITDWLLQGLKEVPSQPACTSMPQTWDKPRGLKIAAEPVSTMIISRPGNVNRKKRPLAADFLDNRKIPLLESDIVRLQGMSKTPLSYLASSPSHTFNTEHGTLNIGSALAYQLPLVDTTQMNGEGQPCGDVTFPKDIDCSDIIPHMDPSNFIDVQKTQSEAVKLEAQTRDQAASTMWADERRKRITASNFGRFMIRKAAVTKKFVDSVTNPKSFNSSATCYGKSNERIAKNMYGKKNNCHVHECGLVINPKFPFIGASPDGKVCDNGECGILEVKCPFLLRDMTLMEAVQSDRHRDRICLKLEGENIVMKKTHNYWFQVQGQLLVTGAKFCDFVVYTRQDLHIIRVKPDLDTQRDILRKLYSVFVEFMGPTTQ